MVPISWRNVLLLIASLCFYAWGEAAYVAIMLASIALNFGFGLAIDRSNNGGRSLLFAAVTINLLILGFFKYAEFFVESIVSGFGGLDIDLIPESGIHLPIGISFFTFQAISYLIDVYRRVLPAQSNPLQLGLYIAFFPQLIAGPIVRYKDIAAQLKYRIVGLSEFTWGIERFVIGLGKKVLIANPLGEIADEIFALPAGSLNPAVAWTGIICYSLQIYFDFSGYSDMAIGLGRMFGFRFLENFNYPYISQSVQEFWRRWHISLSNWFRDYLYIPLGGNRLGASRTYVNLLLVFILCGLWHGASWNFIIWGLLHGLFLILERFGLKRFMDNRWRPLRHLYVLLFVTLAWVFFRVETITGAQSFFASLFGAHGSDLITFDRFYNHERLTVFVIAVMVCTPVLPWIKKHFTELPAVVNDGPVFTENMVFNILKGMTLTVILLLSSVYLISGSYNPFIYFRF